MAIRMCPGSDEALAWHRQVREQARDRIGISIGPAAHRVNRTLDRTVILAHRAVFPISVAPLVPHPRLEEQRQIVQTLQPNRAPSITDQDGIWRMTHGAEQE